MDAGSKYKNKLLKVNEMTKLVNRRDIVILFDVKNGNPNGDPDAGNQPRTDPETSHGYVSDVCLKRKIRNRVAYLKQFADGFDIYVKEKSILNLRRGPAYAALGLSGAVSEDVESKDEETSEEDVPKAKKKGGKKEPKVKKDNTSSIELAKKWMMEKNYDIRTFGAVMSTKLNNAGQVRGPVQVTFSESIDPIYCQEISLTRMAVETEAESKKMAGENKTFGSKWIVPYGLYRGHMFISPPLASQTGFSEEDYNLLIESLQTLFQDDVSAARGTMTVQAILCFEHDGELGNAQSGKLFDLIKVERLEDKPARSFHDYKVTLPTSLPEGVKLFDLLDPLRKIKLA